MKRRIKVKNVLIAGIIAIILLFNIGLGIFVFNMSIGGFPGLCEKNSFFFRKRKFN